MSGPVTSVARVDDVPIYIYIYIYIYEGIILKEIGIGCQDVIINILAEKRAQYSSFLHKFKKKILL